MGRTKTPGIYSSDDEAGSFEVDAEFRHRRLRKRGFATYEAAQDWLTRQKAFIVAGTERGVRPVVTLDAATAHYVLTEAESGKVSLDTEVSLLKPVIEHCGSLTLDEICDDTLRPFIAARRAAGRKAKTINSALAIVRHICYLAAGKWRHENRMTWLEAAPIITMLPLDDQRPPRPISWADQRRLLPRLPDHLARMVLFDLQCGARENVVCNLAWDWEVRVPLGKDLTVSVFVVPRRFVKGRKRERVLICNSVAQSIIETQRGLHPDRVFTYARPVKAGKKAKHVPIGSMNNTAWQRVREEAELGDLHVHDLRHTVGMRLRDAGVAPETRDEVLWHNSKEMSTHYAIAQVREVYQALERITAPSEEGESLNLLALAQGRGRARVPQNSPTQRKTA